MDNILYIGLEYEDEDFLKSTISLGRKESSLINYSIFDFNDIYRDMDFSKMFGGINKLFLRELISEQIVFANCFLNDNELKTITIDSIAGNKKDIKILDVLESKRKYNNFLKEKL